MRPSSSCPRGGSRCDDVARVQPRSHGLRDRILAARCRALCAGKPVPLGGRLCRRRGARGLRVAPVRPSHGGARGRAQRHETRSAVAARAAGQSPPQLVSTSVVWNPACRLHYPGAGHPDRPQRFEVVLDALRRPEIASLIDLVEAAPAPRVAIERVHAAAYIDLLTVMDARGGGGGGGSLDADTFLGPRSWESVLAAPGGATVAV